MSLNLIMHCHANLKSFLIGHLILQCSCFVLFCFCFCFCFFSPPDDVTSLSSRSGRFDLHQWQHTVMCSMYRKRAYGASAMGGSLVILHFGSVGAGRTLASSRRSPKEQSHLFLFSARFSARTHAYFPDCNTKDAVRLVRPWNGTISSAASLPSVNMCR